MLQELDASQTNNLHTYPGMPCYMVRNLIDISLPVSTTLQYEPVNMF